MNNQTFGLRTILQAEPIKNEKCIILIHGVFSSFTACFSQLIKNWEDSMPDKCDIFGYNYDFHLGLKESGEGFYEEIACKLDAYNEIIIIAHSMGGLVSRIAATNFGDTNIKRIILLATPNKGAVTSNHLTLGAQLFMAGFGVVGLRPKSQGISDLTRVPSIFNELLDNEEASPRAEKIEYISIPATYFHEFREDYRLGNLKNMAWTKIILDLMPGFSIPKPHDGIVTENSNNFLPQKAGCHTEKDTSLKKNSDGKYTYAHVRPKISDELNHVEIVSNENISYLLHYLVVMGDLDSSISHIEGKTTTVVTG